MEASYSFFFFNDTATTEIYTTEDTLSLHDALPISWQLSSGRLLHAREETQEDRAETRRLQEEAEEASPSRRRVSSLEGGILGANCVSSGTDSWHPALKLVKSLPMGSPSQDRDAGSNPAGATNLTDSRR